MILRRGTAIHLNTTMHKIRCFPLRPVETWYARNARQHANGGYLRIPIYVGFFAAGPLTKLIVNAFSTASPTSLPETMSNGEPKTVSRKERRGWHLKWGG